jgi:quercetin dioxygenase-like cupin family protein
VARLDESEIRRRLETEGFPHVFVWEDGPGASYPAHTHSDLTAHIILDGEMTLSMNGESRTYRVGERCDVPAAAVHSATMGPQGCRYIIGEK